MKAAHQLTATIIRFRVAWARTSPVPMTLQMIKPAQGTRDEELVRLLALGAREVEDLRNADGTGWVVLADPEGNEFCILRSDAERQS